MYAKFQRKSTFEEHIYIYTYKTYFWKFQKVSVSGAIELRSDTREKLKAPIVFLTLKRSSAKTKRRRQPRGSQHLWQSSTVRCTLFTGTCLLPSDHIIVFILAVEFVILISICLANLNKSNETNSSKWAIIIYIYIMLRDFVWKSTFEHFGVEKYARKYCCQQLTSWTYIVQNRSDKLNATFYRIYLKRWNSTWNIK